MTTKCNNRLAAIAIAAAACAAPFGAQADAVFRGRESWACIKAHHGEVLSRDFLLTRFWGVDFDGGDAALTVAIHRLREKLGPDARLVETVSRQGYRLVLNG